MEPVHLAMDQKLFIEHDDRNVILSRKVFFHTNMNQKGLS